MHFLTLTVLAIAAFFATAVTQNTTAKSEAGKKADQWNGRTVVLPLYKLKAGAAHIFVDVDLPRGYHFTDEAPCLLKWKAADPKILQLPKGINERKGTITFPVEAGVTSRAGRTELTIDAMIFFCENGSKLCQMDNIRIQAPIEISTTGPENITLSVNAGEESEED